MRNLRKECDAIGEQIKALAKNTIIDGIIDFDTYYSKSKPRILWVLKQANSSEDGWDYQSLLAGDNKSWHDMGITLRRVIYTSYGILNNFVCKEDMPDIYKQEVYDAAKHIAIINIKKTGGGQSVEDSVIQQAYKENRELILRQIKVYAPDIIIFGNTMKYMFDDLGIIESDKKYVDKETDNTTYYTKYNQLFINAWSPAYINDGDSIFCNEIISAALKWWQSKQDIKK